jgi:hypothetical protein
MKKVENFMETKEPKREENKEFEVSYDGMSVILQIESVQLRQNISRELHRRYGFGKFKVEFDLDPDNFDFTIVKLSECVEPLKSKPDSTIQQPENPE